MLKIKNEIDLKELIKFRFIENKDYPNYYKTINYNTYTDEDTCIFVDIETREIFCLENDIDVVDLPEYEIQDLIKAGLVEKVEEGIC